MLDLDGPTLISRILTLVIAFTLHEFAHAWTADRFGDMTPRQYGRLTLNPLRHLDVLGSLLLLVAGFGWAKPVPINPNELRRRSPAAVMWVSLAGPFSNFVMAIAAAIPLRLGLVKVSLSLGPSWLPTPYYFLSEFVLINLVLMLFNLIPLPPLDGDKIAEYFAPPALVNLMNVLRPYGSLVLMALIFLPQFFNVDALGWIMNPALSNLWYLLTGGA
jgi:Zn-dependent protease